MQSEYLVYRKVAVITCEKGLAYSGLEKPGGSSAAHDLHDIECTSRRYPSIMDLQDIDGSDGTVFIGQIAEDLVPSRSDQPLETISLDFSRLLDPPLALKQDMTEGCGGKTWPAGIVLTKYILQCRLEQSKGKTMFVRSELSKITASGMEPKHRLTLCISLELGAGSGLVGYVLHPFCSI